MPAKNRQKAIADTAFGYEIAHLLRELVKPGTVSANREEGVGLAQHAGQLAGQIGDRQRAFFGSFQAEKTKAPALRRALITL